MIIKLQNGDKLKIGSDEEARRKYKEYSQLSIGQKLKRNLNIASNFLKSGPNITNLGNAVSALFGGFSPENPDLHYGEAPGVGIKNFENLVRTARVAREFNNVVSKGLKSGSSKVLESEWLDRELNTGDINTIIHFDRGDFKPNYWLQHENGSKVIGGYVNNNNQLVSGDKNPRLWWNEKQPFNAIHKNHDHPFNTPTRYISVPKNSGKFILYQENTQNPGPLEIVSYGPVDLTNASIIEKDPLGWWGRVKYTSSKPLKSKQYRMIPESTYPIYRGPKFNIVDIVDQNGKVNPRKANKAQRAIADWFKQFGKGAYRLEDRLENPKWHVNDPNTFQHTKNVAQSAWNIEPPVGITKQDQMISALGHDLGKIVSGDGHAGIGAAIAEQAFIGIKPNQLQAIREHMGIPTSLLGKITKQADILNGNKL